MEVGNGVGGKGVKVVVGGANVGVDARDVRVRTGDADIGVFALVIDDAREKTCDMGVGDKVGAGEQDPTTINTTELARNCRIIGNIPSGKNQSIAELVFAQQLLRDS